MKPIFCGNFEYDARQSELERLFGRYGKVDRVDMKSGLSWDIQTLPGSAHQNTFLAYDELPLLVFKKSQL